MLKLIAIDAGDGSEKEVDEQYIKDSLKGNWKDVDLAYSDFLRNGTIRTPFQFFKVQRWELRTEFTNDDIKYALDNNSQERWGYDDIAGLICEVPGHNDEDEWYWLGQLKDGRFFGAIGGCDYTGWDCQSYLISWITDTAEAAMDLMAKGDGGKKHYDKMENMWKQFNGEQPFGLEVVS